MAVPNAAAGVNALLDREAQTRSSASRFGPPSPIKSLNHGSFGQPCERALHAAAAFRGEMHQQPDLWFRERYARHLKEATAWMEAYLKVPLANRRLVRLDDNPAYISGGVVFADNTTFLINSLLHHFNYVSADALLISTLSYGMTQKTCHRLSSRASGPAVLAVDFSNLLLLMGNNMNNSGTTTQDSYSLRLGPDFTVKIVAAYRATLQQARQRGVNLRLAIIEHIVSTPSCVLPVAEIAAEVKSFFPEAWVVVDGAHSLGSLPLNLASREWAQVDAFVTNGHKWLYTCRGCAVMWTRHSDILPIITSSATVFPDIAEERCEASPQVVPLIIDTLPPLGCNFV